MSRVSTLSKPDAEFLAQANTIKQQCTQYAGQWSIDQTRVNTLNTLTTNANTAYTANNDSATRNLTTSANKKAAFGELKHFLGLFIDYLESTSTVPDAALEIMGLRSRTPHVHEPLPAPKEAPVTSVVRQHDEITVYVARPEHDHPTQGVKPAKYHGFKLRWRYEGETADRFELSTRLHYTLHFDREDETKRVILSAAWVNPRLEPGPWSEDISEVIG